MNAESFSSSGKKNDFGKEVSAFYGTKCAASTGVRRTV